jgi:radical SAM protein with 4Fe4S-binding SPASM domain
MNYEELFGDAITPQALTIELTKGCSINCSYCYLSEADRTAVYSQEEIDSTALEQCKKITAALARSDAYSGAAMILSAEATTISAPVLAECINILAERIMEVQILTNGVRLADDEYYDTLIAGIKDTNNFAISLTIDGPKEVHDAQRDGSYDAVMITLGKLIRDDLLERVNTIVGLESIKDPEAMLKWYQEVIVSAGIPSIPSSIEPPVYPTVKERIKIAKLLRDMAELNGDSPSNAEETCDAIYINLDGHITTCTNDCGVGDDTRSPELLLESVNMLELLETRKNSVMGIQPECYTCDSSHICNIHCHYHRAPNGYAYNCVYHRDKK